MGRSDSRSALPHFAGALLIGFVAPRPPPGVALQGSHCWGGDGSLLFPRWLSHHSTPSTPPGSSGLHSKLFTPSMAFASTTQARLPVGPLRVVINDAAGFASCCGLVSCTLTRFPGEGLTPRFNARISPNAGGLLQRRLGPSSDRTRTG